MQHPITSYLRTLKASSLSRKIPNISEENAAFLTHIIRERHPRHILEIGTANGYSTLCFAKALLELEERQKSISENSTITTIEYAWNAHIEAVEHFSNCKCKNIHSIWGDAKAVIPTLQDGYFDFVFIDAMKREYLDYLLLSLPKMTDDAIIVIDDVEKFRDKMENLYTFLETSNIDYTLEKTDMDDSVMILYREKFSDSL